MPITLRSFTDFILYGRFRAIGVAFIVTFIPLIGTLSIAIAGLVTLRKGALEGFWVLVAATLPYALLLPFQSMPLGLWVVCVIAASNTLTWLFAILINRYDNWNVVLEIAILIGITVVTTAHAINPHLEAWWGKQLNTYFVQLIPENNAADSKDTLSHLSTAAPSKAAVAAASQQAATVGENTEPETISFINAAKPYATGALAASLLFTTLMQLLMARWWQIAFFNPQKLRQELHNIRLSHMAGLVFLITLILSYLKITLAQDMLPVLYLTFCMAGLSLAHYAIAKIKMLGWLWLFVLYSVLLCTWMIYRLPLAFQLVALTALLDVWVDCREYLNKRFT